MSSRSSELVRQFEANFERKQRNLAKRKSKLDTYREKLAKGEVLNEEQRKAVDGYDGVIQSIAVLQEFITQTKELVEDVEKAAKEDEGQIESAHEEYTVSFLHIHGCLMRLLGALDCPPVRVAVVRCSSENHLRLLDIVKGLVTAPLLDNWPGTSTNSLVNAPSFLQNHPDLESVARNTFDFVTGRPVPIASPEDQPGSHKKYYNFKDARSLCFRLLATPVVQRAMGMPSRPASVASSSKEEINENVDESYKQAHVESESVHVRDDTPIAIPAGDTNNYETDLNVPIQHDVLEQPVQDAAMSVAVDQMIKPLGGTFNFLQASSVSATMDTQPVLGMNSSGAVLPNGVDVQPCIVEEPVNILDQPTPTPNNQYSDQEPEELHTSFDLNEQEVVHSPEVPNSPPNFVPEAEAPAPVPTKPMSYADLVRRPGFSRPVIQNQHNPGAADIKREQHGVSVTGNENFDSSTHPSNQEGSGRRGNPRGRTPNEFRGGRGGASRGNFGGAQRRGGARGGRFDPQRGGSGPYRGVPAGVPQPTC